MVTTPYCTFEAVEHACHQCGASVEDGVAFCTQCRAPQIRVLTVEPPFEVTGVDSPQFHQTVSSASHSIQWSQALPATASAGVVAALLMVVPLGGFGIGMLVSGFLAVVLYHRRDPALSLTPGLGARLGLISGIWGFFLFAIITAIEALVSRSGGELRAALLEALQKSAARSPDAQTQQVFEYLRSPQGLALAMAMSLVIMAASFMLLSSIGGALGAWLLKKKERS